MKNKYLLLIYTILLIVCANVNIYSLDNNMNYDSYYYKDNWVGTDWNGEIVATGEVRVLLKVFKIDDGIIIEIIKDMTGFGHAIIAETIAEWTDEKYEFKFIDGWGNNAFGNIIFNNDETVIFYLDCNEYSDYGKNIGRLYGDTYTLQKGIIEFN
jgi:hypothetical protein